jgi:hypothetical protein
MAKPEHQTRIPFGLLQTEHTVALCHHQHSAVSQNKHRTNPPSVTVTTHLQMFQFICGDKELCQRPSGIPKTLPSALNSAELQQFKDDSAHATRY